MVLCVLFSINFFKQTLHRRAVVIYVFSYILTKLPSSRRGQKSIAKSFAEFYFAKLDPRSHPLALRDSLQIWNQPFPPFSLLSNFFPILSSICLTIDLFHYLSISLGLSFLSIYLSIFLPLSDFDTDLSYNFLIKICKSYFPLYLYSLDSFSKIRPKPSHI